MRLEIKKQIRQVDAMRGVNRKYASISHLALATSSNEKYWLSEYLCRCRAFLASFSTTFFVLLVATAPHPALAATTGTFTQTAWDAIPTPAATALHPGNQAGWTAYSAIHPDLNVVNAGADIELGSLNDSVTHTTSQDFAFPTNFSTTHTTTSDFSPGTTTAGKVRFQDNILLGRANITPVWTFDSNLPQAVSSRPGYGSVEMADLDNDGDLDMMYGYGKQSFDYEKIYGYINNSGVWSRSFAWDAADVGTAARRSTPAIADLDGDGDLDMLVGDANGNVYVYENTNDETSPTWTLHPMDGSSTWTLLNADIAAYRATLGDSNSTQDLTLDLADIDGDGDFDLLLGDFWGKIIGYRNNDPFNGGTGSAGPVWVGEDAWYSGNYSGTQVFGSYANPTLADVDADGDLDLFVTTSSDDVLGYENTGSSTIPVWDTTSVAWSLTNILVTYLSVDFYDADNDGDLDMMVGNLPSSGTAYPKLYKDTGTIAYATSGTYESDIVDTGIHAGYTTLDHAVTLLANTDIQIEVRAGESPSDLVTTWTAFQVVCSNATTPCSSGSSSLSALTGIGNQRYVQYRVTLSGDTSTPDDTVTPSLDSITFNYNNYPTGSGTVIENGDVSMQLDIVQNLTPVATVNTSTGDYIRGVRVAGDKLYLTTEGVSGCGPGTPLDYLRVRNLADHVSPLGSIRQVSLGSTRGLAEVHVHEPTETSYIAREGTGFGIVLSNNSLYNYVPTGSATQVFADSTHGYMVAGGALEIIDITAPSAPTFESRYIPAASAVDVFAFGNYVYLALGASGIDVLDVTDPANPVRKATIAETASAVFVLDDILYVAGSGLQTYDVSNPLAPQKIGDTGTTQSGSKIQVAKGYAYIKSGAPVIAFDVTSPGDPQLVPGGALTGSSSSDFSVSGRFAYTGVNGNKCSSIPGKIYAFEFGSYPVSPANRTYTSSVINIGGNTGYTTLDFNHTNPASNTDPTPVQIQLRSGNTNDPDDGSWTGWSAAVTTTGAVISGLGLGTDKYVQYKVTFTTNDATVTPVLHDVTINFTRLATYGWLESSPYNTIVDANILDSLGWTETLPAGTDIRFQIRTAPDNAGSPGTWSAWTGPDNSANSYWNSVNTHAGGCTGSGAITCDMAPIFRDGLNDRWFQYRVEIISDGAFKPTLSDVSVAYSTATVAGSKITITQTSSAPLETDELGTVTETFDIALDQDPSSAVIIDLYITDIGEGSVSPSRLTFPASAGGGTTPQTVTVTGVNDDIDDGPQTYYLLTGAARSADNYFDDVNANDSAAITNLDDDVAGVTVTPPTGLVTGEDSTTDTFTVQLNSEPTQSVTINVSSADIGEGVVLDPFGVVTSSLPLTFTPANWNTAQMVTIQGVDDFIIEQPSATYDIQFVSSSSGEGSETSYDAFSISNVGVTNTDNDSAGIIVCVPSGSSETCKDAADASPLIVSTNEPFGIGTFKVRLTAQPFGTVSFTMASNDTTEGNVLPFLMSFDSTNWDTGIVASLNAANDDDGSVADNPQVDYLIITTDMTAMDAVNDSAWVGFPVADIPARTIDDDGVAPTIDVAPTTGLVTTEDGGVAQFAIRLTRAPAVGKTVTIDLASDDATEGVVSPASITFTESDSAFSPKYAKITGLGDREEDGNILYKIVTSINQTDPLLDPAYLGIDPVDVSVTNTDVNGSIVNVLDSNIGSARFGRSVTTGNINGDAYPDLIVGAYGYNSNRGRVYVYLGSSTGYTNTPYWIADYSGNATSYFGISVAAADVDGDGYDDVIVGAHQAENGTEGNEGRAYVFYNTAANPNALRSGGSVLSTTADWIVESNQANGYLGVSVANAGRVNNDAFDDIIIGAYGYGTSSDGTAFVFYGSASGLPDAGADGVADVATDASWAAKNKFASSYFGWRVAGVGDVNGDGYDDVFAGAFNYSNGQSQEGAAYVFYGSATGLPVDTCGTVDSIAEPCEAWWLESNLANARLGISAASAGNVNGDIHSTTSNPLEDLILGADGSVSTAAPPGRVFVFHGSETGLAMDTGCDAVVDGISDTCLADFTVVDTVNSGYFGRQVASVGNFNSDLHSTTSLPLDDIIVGAYNSQKVFIYTGSDTGLASPAAFTKTNTAVAGGLFGIEVGGIGDINSDGVADYFVGADGYDNPTNLEGAVFVYLSNKPLPGITVMPTSGLVTTEAGDTASFDVSLDSAPSADVTIGLSVSLSVPGGRIVGSLSTTSLTFTQLDWRTSQTITVTGLNDIINDGDQSYSIITAAAVSTDTGYNGLPVADVSLTNLNDDHIAVPTVTMTHTNAPEAGSGRFTFTRDNDTTNPLTVNFSHTGGTATSGVDFIALGANVNIDIPAGSTSVDVIVQPNIDYIDEANKSVTVTLNDIGTYLIGTVTDTLTIIDDDVAGILASPNSGLVTTETGMSDTFSLQLTSQPVWDVDVAIVNNDVSEVSFISATNPIVFTPTDWSSPRIVTLVGQADADVVDTAYTLTLNATSADTNYNIAGVTVSGDNLDVDTRQTVSLLATKAAIDEGSTGLGRFTVTRNVATATPLDVFFNADGGTALASVDFLDVGTKVTISENSTSADIVIDPIDDALTEGDETVVLTLVNGMDYLAAKPFSDTVIIADDETSQSPLANFYVDQTVGEGATTTIDVALSGTALSYPVTIPYTISGTATGGVDHDAIDGNIVINAGTSGSVTVNALTDVLGESDETVIFTMGTPTNARVGSRTTHTITITDTNVAPAVTLAAVQGGLSTHLVTTAGGNVTVTATVSDANPLDTHSYDWSATNATVLANEVGGPSTSATFVFDPTGLTDGDFYALRLTVTDNGTGPLATAVDLMLEVDVAPTLTTVDSDNDGTTDDIESYDDSDGDGIADYLDDSTLGSQELQMYATQSDTYIIRTEPGLTLKLGETALAAGSDGALVSASDIVNYGAGEGQPGANATDTVPNSGGYFDFEISGLQQAGQSVKIVLPQLAPLPTGAVYRKYDAVTGWRNYGENASNLLASAPGTPGVCPLPGDSAYTAGLTAGHHCVQLTIQDGGPNDMDDPGNATGLVNYVIKDPAQMGVMPTATESGNDIVITINDAGGSGGGVVNPGFLIMLCLFVIGVSRRKVLQR